MGRRLKVCDDCGYEEYSYCSCRNRNCPSCQIYAKEKWIEARSCELINTRYFHIVFTLPHKLNEIIQYNKRTMYNLLFKSVSETLLELGNDKQHVGAQIGALLVLHTWCQKILFHTHLHCIIPGGGLKNNHWITCKKKIFIHVKILSIVFRKKYIQKFEELYNAGKLEFPKDMEYLYNQGNFEDFRDMLYRQDWYTYSKKTFSNPRAVIEYLGRYTHRIAITNNRIIDFKDGKVTFKWRDNKENGKEKVMTITGSEFIRRFLLHVLPAGFMKIRYIGIHGNRNKKTKLKLCQELTNTIVNAQKTIEQLLQKMTKGKIFICPACNGTNFHLAGVIKNTESNNTT